MKTPGREFMGRPPGLAEAVYLLCAEDGWERFMHLIHECSTDVVDVDRLIREVIAAVCRKYDPTQGELWKFLGGTIWRIAQNVSRREQRRLARTDPLPDDFDLVGPRSDDIYEWLYATLDADAFRVALQKGWRQLSPGEGYLLFLQY